jgi:hypothetical protein
MINKDEIRQSIETLPEEKQVKILNELVANCHQLLRESKYGDFDNFVLKANENFNQSLDFIDYTITSLDKNLPQ